MTFTHRLLTAHCLLGSLFVLSIAPARGQERKDSLATIRQALEGSNVDRQRAALVVIPDMVAGLTEPAQRRTQGAAFAKEIEQFLKRTKEVESIELALLAYGNLNPPPAVANGVLKPYFASSSVVVRRAAGQALVELISASVKDFGRPVILTEANLGSASLAGGAAPALVWLRSWTAATLKNEPAWGRFGEDARQLLPLCAIALADSDDKVKTAGADGMQQFAKAIVDVLPDPRSSDANTKLVDPFESKLKWLLLQPTFTAINANSPALRQAMTTSDLPTRMAATRAAYAVTQARALALASRRFPPDDLSVLSDKPLPQDALQDATLKLLPALSERLDDPSADIRLVAIEAFEFQGSDARLYLPAIIHASRNSDIFVRWVATRTLGRLYSGASGIETAQISGAIDGRILDADIDVRSTALTAAGRGKQDAQPTTGAILQLVAAGDPDQRVQAIRTLGLIKADPAQTLSVLGGVLNDAPNPVRKQAMTYLGSLGRAARPVLPQLRPLLLDENEEVRREAAKALLAIE